MRAAAPGSEMLAALHAVNGAKSGIILPLLTATHYHRYLSALAVPPTTILLAGASAGW